MPVARNTGMSLEEEIRHWCRGRWWWTRIPILLLFGYFFANLVLDPTYNTVFKPLDLGIHELGHIIFHPFGMFMELLGGSLTQCLVPLISIPMFYRQRDFFAIAFCFGWLGLNLYEVGTYIADARAQAIVLVSPFGADPLHDWNYILTQLGRLDQDVQIGNLVRTVGAVCILFFLMMGSWLVWLMMTQPE